MEQIATIAQSALQAAHQATDRLMRQMLTIADTSASVERRIEEARQQTEERDKDSFARRVAVLIEALNSTAIDVSKILSNEVADSSWAAYLKGDRRSEEHTSELQSLMRISYAVFCLKKKKQ